MSGAKCVMHTHMKCTASKRAERDHHLHLAHRSPLRSHQRRHRRGKRASPPSAPLRPLGRHRLKEVCMPEANAQLSGGSTASQRHWRPRVAVLCEVHGRDGDIGRLEGFAPWHLAYLDVKGGEWLLCRSVLFPVRSGQSHFVGQSPSEFGSNSKRRLGRSRG